MVTTRRQVELLEKNKPRQERAKRTYEGILSAAAELLVEVGVERISTNIIAERAGITVPALYRYFPNKYAVLNALGAALMDAQNRAFQQWFEGHLEEAVPGAVLGDLYEVLRLTYEVTRAQTGGVEIIQSLRAVAPLQELRLSSHRLVADQFCLMVSELLQRPADELMRMQARLSVDTGYAIVEMALEDSTLPHQEILRQGAQMLSAYWRDILDNPP
jgi:AcrR family transcriptional regulator